MAPESNPSSTNPNSPVAEGSQLVRVPEAAAGARIAVEGAAGANYQFDFNPGDALMARDGSSLVFDLDGGGSVVIENFFVLGDDGGYPNFVMEDGTEIPSLALLEGAGLDTTPAAGPAASATPPGGGTNYDDDGGSLIDGIDRLGSLGTFHWGRASEVPIQQIGAPTAGGTVSFEGGTGFGAGGIGLFKSFVYEDGRPVQHEFYEGEEGDRFEPGRIAANIEPNTGSSVSNITISGFPAGTEVWLGEPYAPGSVQITLGAGGSYSGFSVGDFTSPGVYFLPPENSDDDFTLNFSVTFSAPGAPDAIETGSFRVAVDAAADRPDEFAGSIEVDTQDDTEVDTPSKPGDLIATGEAKDIAIKLEAQFGDYKDGSEEHYFRVDNIPSDWILDEASLPMNPDGSICAILRKDGEGNLVEMTYQEYLTYVNGLENSATYDLYVNVTEIASAQNGGDGSVAAELHFNPGDWTTGGTGVYLKTDGDGNPEKDAAGNYIEDPNGTAFEGGRYTDGTVNLEGSAQIVINAVARETATNDNDYTNNESVVSQELVTVDLKEDTPGFTSGDKGHQTLPVDDVIGNVGLGEATTGGTGHGAGEFSFHGESNPKNYNLSEELSNTIKDLVQEIAPNTPNQDIPLGINHAYGDGTNNDPSGNAGNITKGREGIVFDMHSDGANDVAGNNLGGYSISWAAADELLTATGSDSGAAHQGTGLWSKLTDQLVQEQATDQRTWTDNNDGTYTVTGEDSNGETYTQTVNSQGYAELQFAVENDDATGQSLMYGFFYDNAGNKVIALVGVLTPTFDATDGTGYADITFVEYTPLYHSDGSRGDNMQSYFKVVLTDDDGDQTTGHVQYRVLDDLPTVGGAQTVYYDESEGNSISGNVLTDTNNDHSTTNDTGANKASSGSDGWYGGGSGNTGDAIVSYKLSATNGYVIKDANGAEVSSFSVKDGNGDVDFSKLGPQTYTVYDADGNVAGTLLVDTDGSYSFTKNTDDSGLKSDFNITIDYTVMDADGDTKSSDLNIKVDAQEQMYLYIKGDKVIYEEGTDEAVAAGTVPGTNNAQYTIYWTTDSTDAQQEGNDPDTIHANSSFSFGLAISGKTGVGAGGIDYGNESLRAEESGDMRIWAYARNADGSRYDAAGNLINEDGYLVDADGDFIDASGDPLGQSDTPVKGTPVKTYLEREMTADSTTNGDQDDYNKEFLEALNAQLKLDYPDGGVTATGVTWTNDWPTITFEVKDGTELKPITLNIEATDDMMEDSGEKFQVSLVDPDVTSGGGVDSPVVIVEDPNAQGSGLGVVTEIRDGTGETYGSGGMIGLNKTIVVESTVKAVTDEKGNILDAKGDIVIDAKGNVINPDGKVAYVENKTVDAHVNVSWYNSDGTPNTGLTPPAEDMTLTFGYGKNDGSVPDDAGYDKDFVAANNTGTISRNDWVAKDEDGNVLVKYDSASNLWQYKNPDYDSTQPAGPDNQEWLNRSELTEAQEQALEGSIEQWENTAIIKELIVDDSLSETDESFDIWIEDVKGNECDVLKDSQGNNKSGSTVTIEDDKDMRPENGQLEDGKQYLDGPRLVGVFTGTEKNGTSQLYEPKAQGKDGGAGDQFDSSGKPVASNDVTYRVVFDQEAEENITVTLRVDTNGAVYGEDFRFAEGTVYKDVDSNGDGVIDYYEVTVTVEGGKGKDPYAEFTVEVLHDHDDTSRTGGLDSGVESITVTVTGMEGSEVQWDDSPDAVNGGYDAGTVTNKGVFVDDGHGPVVHMDSYSAKLVDGKVVFSGSVNVETNSGETSVGGVAVGEGVDVVIAIYDVNLRLIGEYPVTVGTDGSFEPLSIEPDGSTYYMQVKGTNGGETDPDKLLTAPIKVGTGTGPDKLADISVKGDEYIEEGGSRTSYTITVKVPDAGVDGNVEFTVTVFDNTTKTDDFTSTLEGTSAGGLDVVLNKDFVNNDPDGKIVIEVVPKPGGNGETGFTVEIDGVSYDVKDGNLVSTDGLETIVGSIKGELPGASIDGKLEGTEYFTPVITDMKHAEPDSSVTPDPVAVKDAPVTLDVVFGVLNGDVFTPAGQKESPVYEGGQNSGALGPEDLPAGSRFVVQVSLSDTSGTVIIGSDPVVIQITAKAPVLDSDGNQVKDSDGNPVYEEHRVTLHSENVTMHPGQNGVAYVEVTLPNNYLTETMSEYTFTAKVVDGVSGVADKTSDTVYITEVHDGPQLSLVSTSDDKTVYENNGNGIEYIAKLDQAASEDVTVTMQLTFDSMDPADTASGFTPADISTLTVGEDTFSLRDPKTGEPYQLDDGDTVTLYAKYDESGDPVPNSASIVITGGIANGKPTWSFDVTIEEGYAAERVIVGLNNDTTSEATEKVNMEIIGADGSEVVWTPGSDAVKVDTNLGDSKGGPKLSLSAAQPSVEEGNDVTFNLNLSSKVEADAPIRLKLAAGWENVVEADAPGVYHVTVTIGGVTSQVPVDPADGSFDITLKAGTPAGNVTISVPTADNPETGTAELGLGIDNIGIEGEATMATVPNLTSTLVAQGNGFAQYECASTTATAPADATVTYTLSGLNDVAGQNIQYSLDGGATWQTVSVNTKGEATVVVTHDQGEALKDSFLLNTGKPVADRSATITGKVVLESTVTVQVKDEAANQDGLELSLSAALVGGSMVHTVDLTPKGDYYLTNNKLGGMLTFTLAFGGMDPADVTAMVAGWQTKPLPTGMTAVADANGVVTVTLDEGYDLANNGPFTFNVPGNGQVTVELAVDSANTTLEVAEVDNASVSNVYYDYSGNAIGEVMTGEVSGTDALILGSGFGDTLYGGAGDDTIHGGNGDDLIFASSDGSTIYGGAGEDTIFAGKGDDLLSGGLGDDLFVWTKDAMTDGIGTGVDTIADFEYKGVGSTDGDKIVFSDLFGDDPTASSSALESLLDAASLSDSSIGANSKTFTFEKDGTTIEAEFHDDNSLMLTLKGSDNVEQSIMIQSNDNLGYDANMSADEAAEILSQIIQTTTN